VHRSPTNQSLAPILVRMQYEHFSFAQFLQGFRLENTGIFPHALLGKDNVVASIFGACLTSILRAVLEGQLASILRAVLEAHLASVLRAVLEAHLASILGAVLLQNIELMGMLIMYFAFWG